MISDMIQTAGSPRASLPGEERNFDLELGAGSGQPLPGGWGEKAMKVIDGPKNHPTSSHRNSQIPDSRSDSEFQAGLRLRRSQPYLVTFFEMRASDEEKGMDLYVYTLCIYINRYQYIHIVYSHLYI